MRSLTLFLLSVLAACTSDATTDPAAQGGPIPPPQGGGGNPGPGGPNPGPGGPAPATFDDSAIDLGKPGAFPSDLVRTGDGYDAARVLLLDPERIDGLLVALPERDCLWVGEAPGEQLARLMELNAEQSARSAHPVSPHLYRLRSGQLEPVTGVDR